MENIRLRFLPVRKLSNLANKLTVNLIMTPCEQFTKIKITCSVGLARQRMQDNEFDQLPVERDGHIVGLVKLSSLNEILDEDIVSNYVDEKVPNVDETVKLVKVLQPLQSTPCIFVMRDDKVVGLIHSSDLNKQAMRIYFYLWIAALEMGLATIVKSKYELPGEWVTLLSLKKQRSILKGYIFAKKRNLDANPIEQAELSDLVKVIQKNEVIRCLLGFPKTKDWKDATGNLIDLRNRIMHPTRTLIDIDCGVEDLISRENNLKKLIITVDASLL